MLYIREDMEQEGGEVVEAMEKCKDKHLSIGKGHKTRIKWNRK